MRIQHYGITLRRLVEQDLELVRIWRNSDNVKPFMHYREHITKQMQQHWFSSLVPSQSLYLIIEHNATALGLVNLKNINRLQASAEAGIFIGDTDYNASLVPVLATCLLMRLAFEGLGLQRLEAKISRNNKRAIRFNETLGYRLTTREADYEFVYYEVQRDDFYRATANFAASFSKLTNTTSVMEISETERRELEIALDFTL